MWERGGQRCASADARPGAASAACSSRELAPAAALLPSPGVHTWHAGELGSESEGELDELYQSDTGSNGEEEQEEQGGGAGKAGEEGAAASRQERLVCQLEHELTAPGEEHPAVAVEPAATGELA